MSGEDLIRTIRRAAKICVANGETSKEIFARADEQERTGFGVSASYTRLLAQAVKEEE